MRTKEEDKEYKEAMEYIMAKERKEKQVLGEIEKKIKFLEEVCKKEKHHPYEGASLCPNVAKVDVLEEILNKIK